MRKVLAVMLLALGSAAAHAESPKAQAFDCMDSKTFEVNSQCMSGKISSNLAFTNAQQEIVYAAADNAENAMATVSFYPKLRLIEVVAHRDATYAKLAKAEQTNN